MAFYLLTRNFTNPRRYTCNAFHPGILNPYNGGVNWTKKAPPKRGWLVLPALLGPEPLNKERPLLGYC